MEKLESFFSSWRFPVFMLSVLVFFLILVISISLVPVSDSGIGAFAEEFKTWCLGYDPATGETESIYLVMFIVQPLILSLFILAFWHKPLAEILKSEPRKAIPAIASALLIVLSVASSFPAIYSPARNGELPFPAEEIRTQIEPPAFTLVNQDNEEITLADLRDDVVMVTAIYASCADACPLILKQARRVLDQLQEEEPRQVHLLAITMNPDTDTPGMLKMVAEHYGLDGPNQHLLTGDPEKIETVLDRLNIPRRPAENGQIDHASIFLLVDKAGYIAYRFTVGERQEEWLLKATRLLVNEPVERPDKLSEL